MSKPNPTYLKVARQIATDERGGIEHRFDYGSMLLAARVGRQRLPKGYLADRIAEMERAGLPKVSERELQRWMKFAEVYPTKAHRRQALALKGSWNAIVEDGFPEVIVDEGLIDSEDLEMSAPDEWEQLSLLPGFAPTIRLHRREIRSDEMTVPEALEYRDSYRSKHEGFAKTLDQIERTCVAILDGWDGDPLAKAADAYQRGSGPVTP